MDKIVVNFVFERATKGAIRYMEVDDNGEEKRADNGMVIGTLYIRKTALKDSVPQKLTVTMT